ncbi:hypothetical protein QBC36DRAFT_136021 [Triangularia setosa]|uniref:RNA-binding protein n=1 Tax=Triangularia setosa TaxID=2587417 RepID=A0AAN6W951_9PEZI|nr:hypothetical protein QBC36DRAFT_136021 [Podospora setosa]
MLLTDFAETSKTPHTGFKKIVSSHRQFEVDHIKGSIFSSDYQSEIDQINGNNFPSSRQVEAEYRMNGNAAALGHAIMNSQNASNDNHTVNTDTAKTPRPKFRPMDALNQPEVLREEDREVRRLLGFSESYKGDIHNAKNWQPDISDNENVSVFLTNLPRVYSERELVSALVQHGPFDRLYAASVTPPREGHTGSSAKIVLFTRSGAESLHTFINSGKFFVDGWRIQCCWNKIKHPAPGGAKYLSRVIIIWAKKTVLDEQKLSRLLDDNLVYQLEDTRFNPVKDNEGINRIEVRFCSFRAQAEAFRILLSSEVPEAKVRFGVDPLAVTAKDQGFAKITVDDKWARLGRFRRGEN